ncbi:hypothetical protein D3C72_886070 [compost metagenome]
MSDHFYNVDIKGTAKDVHERFPITFDYSPNGLAYFNGCKLHVSRDVQGNTIIDKVDIRAFGEVAEALAGVTDGAEIHIRGEHGKQKGRGEDKNYYDIITVTEVISID